MNSRLIIGLIVIVLGIMVGWFFLGGKKITVPQQVGVDNQVVISPILTPVVSYAPTNAAMNVSPTGEMMAKGGEQERIVITYTAKGFAPKEVTVKTGTMVVFMNDSTRGMWIANVQDATHQALAGFDQLKSVSTGGSFEYAFTKIGTWKFQNHVNPTDTGIVIVTP